MLTILSYLDTLYMFVAVMKQVRWAMKASYSAEKLKTCIKQKKSKSSIGLHSRQFFLTRLFHTLGYLKFRASNNAIKNVIEPDKKALTSS